MTAGQSPGAWTRIGALARKDAAELARNPGATLPAVAMVFGALLPAFLVVGAPILTGSGLSHSGEFEDAARAAAGVVPELAGLEGVAIVQAFLFHQFALLLLLVPVVGAMALASHAVVGEKQAKALEPLLATPLSTVELLAAKTLTPFAFATVMLAVALVLYLVGIAAVAEPGVWRAMLGTRTVLLFGVLAPLVTLAALQLAVIVSSRASDPRSAQQLSSLMVLPITAVFVAQMVSTTVMGPMALWQGIVGCAVLNGVLVWAGASVFRRETILTRWK